MTNATRWWSRGSLLPAPALALLLAIGGCASWVPELARLPSHAIDGGEFTRLGRVFAAQASRHPGRSGFKILVSGESALATRAALAVAAERTIDLQYYSVDEDLTTDLLLQRLLEAAERGVRIRILLDDIQPSTRRFAWRAMAAHPAIQVRLFNPFYFGGTASVGRLAEFMFDSERLNRRMHNKLWITDNAAAIVGSRNLGAAYFEANAAGNFHDVDLLSVGPVVQQMSRAFDAYWNSVDAVPAQTLVTAPQDEGGSPVGGQRQSRMAICNDVPPCRWVDDDRLQHVLRAASESLSWASARFFYDRPGQAKPLVPSGIEHGWNEDHPEGVRTQRELLIVSPYFVPSEAGLRHLRQMRERGVRVAILTNSLASTDSPAAHAGYARYRPALLRNGVELYEIRLDPGVPHERAHRWQRTSPSSLHAKFIVHDRRHAIVGSLNQDPRSRLYNTEAWVAVDSAELAADLAAIFEEGSDLEHAYRLEAIQSGDTETLVWETQESGKAVRSGAEPLAESWLGLWRNILGALVPEHLL